MKIDDANGEMTKYNNSAAKYNMYYQAYQNAYNRAHLPKSEAAYIKMRGVLSEADGAAAADADHRSVPRL